MAVDPILWSIVGVEDQRFPLSARSNGPWVLRPPTNQFHVAPEINAPELLARETVSWIVDDIAKSTPSMESMFAEIRNSSTEGHDAIEVCLHFLREDWTAAETVIRRGVESGECGGLSVGREDGTTETFFAMATRWMAARRRERFFSVQAPL
jgi:hypothetical protein